MNAKTFFVICFLALLVLIICGSYHTTNDEHLMLLKYSDYLPHTKGAQGGARKDQLPYAAESRKRRISKGRFGESFLLYPSERLGHYLRRRWSFIFLSARLYISGIPKNMFSQLRSLYCDHEFHIGSSVDTAEGFEELHIGKCKQAQLAISTNQTIRGLVDSSWRKIVLVRDPVDRLISAYLHICRNKAFSHKCYGCKRDFHCFVHRNCEYIRNVSINGIFATEWRYIHYFPQAWFGRFQSEKSLYEVVMLPKYPIPDSFKNWFRNRLIENGLKNKTKVDKMFTKGTYHAANNRSEVEELRNNLLATPMLLRRFYLTYAVDYETFGLLLPEETAVNST